MAPPLPDNPGGSPVVMPTLLLVEDTRIIALDLARRLTKLGYTVLAIAGSGREAVQQAVDLRPDLVLMDVGCPGGMDKLEAAAHIRALAEIPIIYLTGSPEGVIPAGFTIQKPVMDQTLPQTIQLALATVDSQAPGHPVPRGDAAGTPASPSVVPAGTSGEPGGQAPGECSP